MRHIAVSAVLAITLAFAATPAQADPIGQTQTFTWFCDSNCEVAANLGFSVSFDLSFFHLDGTAAPFAGTLRAEYVGGGYFGNSIIGSQNPANVANVLSAYNDPLLNELVVQLSGPASFYYGFNGVELTAHGDAEIRDWYINAVGEPTLVSVGHFSYCTETGTGACTNFTAVPDSLNTLTFFGLTLGGFVATRQWIVSTRASRRLPPLAAPRTVAPELVVNRIAAKLSAE